MRLHLIRCTRDKGKTQLKTRSFRLNSLKQPSYIQSQNTSSPLSTPSNYSTSNNIIPNFYTFLPLTLLQTGRPSWIQSSRQRRVLHQNLQKNHSYDDKNSSSTHTHVCSCSSSFRDLSNRHELVLGEDLLLRYEHSHYHLTSGMYVHLDI